MKREWGRWWGRELKQYIKLQPVDEEIIGLPIQYNHIVQALIYNSLDEDLRSFLHEQGFEYKKRTYIKKRDSRKE